MKAQYIAFILAIVATVQNVAADKAYSKEKDTLRKLIIFDKKTPDVFYCPLKKPSDNINKVIVRARPLHKLCELEGHPIPAEYKSDCYLNIDESDYACKEKYRIMKKIAKEGPY